MPGKISTVYLKGSHITMQSYNQILHKFILPHCAGQGSCHQSLFMKGRSGSVVS